MKQEDYSDAELISRLRAGEKRALDVLYNRYAGLVYSVAFKMLQNCEDAEEICQDVFLTFWQKDNYNPRLGKLSTFLGGLTRFRSLDKIRKSNRTDEFFSRCKQIIHDSSFAPLPLEQLTMEEQRQQLREKLELLPIEQREILMMNYFEGLSRNQIAEKLNIPVGTVKSRVRLAFVKLKRLLAE